MEQKITPFLWFDTQAEEAAEHYTSIFEDSRIVKVGRYPEGTPMPAGSVMTVEFEIAGQRYVAMNGGPEFRFNEAVSLCVACEDQEEVDYYWSRLGEGGEEGPCGWLKDKYGLSWQVTPRVLEAMMTDPDPGRAARAAKAMMSMKKIDIQTLRHAVEGADS
ncbi:VOC family protein [Streptomyces somaliensis DSM 40738]|uniref:VOC family protein n=1 Tax=Streptomyces somaliensis (strain ATCC 33201 / DSM 40738 / JCM 12659 / KCTC 9044 / NCTC 11332 / NRRL B-12077 / IP 733) TaxID=1134445 RepID=A0AA44DDG8_STRE0|nr:VOC family protein [Streptomyces somaliensis]MCQ0022911.1 VOC family protein [Streptomyces somaliensis DSM 40738]NKY14156.1 VOC family protein [Streptomyces somaliensis DSM 40738]